MDYFVDDVYAQARSTEYCFYMDDDIGHPLQYRELFHALEYATENDVIKIIVCSHGGMLHSTIMLCNAIRSSEATVVGVLNSIAYSGASCVLLACDGVEVKPHSSFMAHTSHGGIGDDKLSDSTRAIMHNNKQIECFYRDIYEDFFTPTEIDEILDGKDMWLYDEEIIERLKIREDCIHQKLEEQFKEQEEDVPSRDELKKLRKDKLIDMLIGEDI